MPETDAEQPESTAAAAAEGWVVVRVGRARFGLPVERVREVLRTPPLSRVPLSPDAIAGVVSVRGTVVPVLDLGLRVLSAPAVRPGRLVVVERAEDDEPVGLLVDGVDRLIDRAAAVEEPPEEAEVALPDRFISGIITPESGDIVTLLELDPVLELAEDIDSDEQET